MYIYIYHCIFTVMLGTDPLHFSLQQLPTHHSTKQLHILRALDVLRLSQTLAGNPRPHRQLSSHPIRQSKVATSSAWGDNPLRQTITVIVQKNHFGRERVFNLCVQRSFRSPVERRWDVHLWGGKDRASVTQLQSSVANVTEVRRNVNPLNIQDRQVLL